MDLSQVRSGRGSRRLDCFFGIWQHVKRIQRKLSRPTSELSRQRCGRGRGNRDLLVRRTGSGTTSMLPPGAVQPPKRGKVAPFVSMWLLESFRNEPKVRPKTWFTVHDALPGSSTLCINFYAQSATSTNHTRFFRACGRNTYWRLPELIPKHGLAHAYLALTPDRRLLLPRIQGVCVHNSGSTSQSWNTSVLVRLAQ